MLHGALASNVQIVAFMIDIADAYDTANTSHQFPSRWRVLVSMTLSAPTERFAARTMTTVAKAANHIKECLDVLQTRHRVTMDDISKMFFQVCPCAFLTVLSFGFGIGFTVYIAEVLRASPKMTGRHLLATGLGSWMTRASFR